MSHAFCLQYLVCLVISIVVAKGTPLVNDPPNAEESRPGKNVPGRFDDFQCYQCNDFQGGAKKCSEQTTHVQAPCRFGVCHYIVGDVVENGKKVSNVVFAGCDTAPALSELAGLKQSITHTAHKNLRCQPFDFVHSDQGASPSTGRYSISFKGQSCNCGTSGCNKAFSTLFTNSASTGPQYTYLLAFVSLLGIMMLFS